VIQTGIELGTMLNWQYNWEMKRRVELLDFIMQTHNAIFNSGEIEAMFLDNLVTITYDGLSELEIQSDFIKAKVTFKGLWAYHVIKSDGRNKNYYDR
jgi:hypothetical protein